MFKSETQNHKANRNNIDKVIAAKTKPVAKMTKTKVDNLIKARTNIKVTWNPLSGLPAIIQGDLSQRLSGSPSEIARSYLAENSEIFGLKQDLSNLVEIDQIEWGGFQHVRFQQTYDGIPVYGAELLVAIDPNKTVKMVTSDIKHILSLPSENGVVTKKKAIQTALNDLGEKVVLAGNIVSEIVFYPTLKGYVKCYHIMLPASEPLGDWEYFIEVNSGKIVDSANVMRFAWPGIRWGSRGYVYLQNPNDTPQTTGMLRNLKIPYFRLDGTYVKVENDDGPEANSAAGGKFYYAPDTDTHFDEVNCYHAADMVYRYFKDLGFRGFTMNNPYGKNHGGQIRAHVHYGTSSDDAFFRMSTGEIYFGDGSYPSPGGFLDLAKASDVIFHEFTHAVLDELRPGIIGTDGAALHEGYADYFACSFTNPPEPNLGEYVVAGTGEIRNLRNTRKYTNASTEPHLRGLVWGGACWDLRSIIGGEVADYLLFGSMLYQSTRTPTFKYAKDRLLTVDAIHCGGEYNATIKKIFETEREIPA